MFITTDALRLVPVAGLIEFKDVGMNVDREGNICILIKGLRKIVKYLPV